jgi:hypothetical protein
MSYPISADLTTDVDSSLYNFVRYDDEQNVIGFDRLYFASLYKESEAVRSSVSLIRRHGVAIKPDNKPRLS